MVIAALQRLEAECGFWPGTEVYTKLTTGKPEYPSIATIRKVLGNYNTGIKAAGGTPRPRGRPGHADWDPDNPTFSI